MAVFTQSALSLRPEHLSALAACAKGVLGVCIRSAGRLRQDGFELFGRLEFLANCGLVELIERVEKPAARGGEVWLYYAMTERGRILLRWRLGEEEAGAIEAPPADAPEARAHRTPWRGDDALA